MILKAEIKDKMYLLINICAPNKDTNIVRLHSHGTRRIFNRLKIDGLLCSHGTVQYFCSVHTELTYLMKF